LIKVLVHKLGLLPPSARKASRIAAICKKAVGRKGRGELNVVVMDRAGMKKINRLYLSHSHDTDVIAFRYPDEPGADAPFGDVYISAYQARRQAAEMGHSVLHEVLTLAAHGSLHLLGYDDRTAKGKAEMFRLQDKIVGPAR
jgi:probable rRNA maturation factor